MKKLVLFAIVTLFGLNAIAQSRQKLIFKTIAKDKNGAIVANTPLVFKISIIKGSSIGDVQFVETHAITTDAQGAAIIDLGKGTYVSGSLDAIDWENELLLIKTEIESLGITRLSKIKKASVANTTPPNVAKPVMPQPTQPIAKEETEKKIPPGHQPIEPEDKDEFKETHIKGTKIVKKATETKKPSTTKLDSTKTSTEKVVQIKAAIKSDSVKKEVITINEKEVAKSQTKNIDSVKTTATKAATKETFAATKVVIKPDSVKKEATTIKEKEVAKSPATNIDSVKVTTAKGATTENLTPTKAVIKSDSIKKEVVEIKPVVKPTLTEAKKPVEVSTKIDSVKSALQNNTNQTKVPEMANTKVLPPTIDTKIDTLKIKEPVANNKNEPTKKAEENIIIKKDTIIKTIENSLTKTDTINTIKATVKPIKKNKKSGKNTTETSVKVENSINNSATQKLSYQTTIKNINGVVFSDAPVIIKLNVLKDSPTGQTVFTETHTTVTDDEGKVNLVIGNGVANSGNLESIDWNKNTYFIKTETNPTGFIKIEKANSQGVDSTILPDNSTISNEIERAQQPQKIDSINTSINTDKKIATPVKDTLQKVDISKNTTIIGTIPKIDTAELKLVPVKLDQPKTIDTTKTTTIPSVVAAQNKNISAGNVLKDPAMPIDNNSWESVKQKLQEQNETINEDPNSINAYLTRGIIKSELQDYRGAISDFNKVLEIDPKNVETYNARGIAKTQLKNYKGAIEDFEMALKINPRYANAFASRGLAQASMEDYSSAIADFDTAITIAPDSAIFYSYRGTCKYNTKDYAGALNDYDIAIKINPKDALSYYNRGNTQTQLKASTKAIEDYNKTLLYNPNYSKAYFKRANAKADLQDVRGALIDYDKAIQLDPQNSKAYFNAGVMKTKIKDYEGAINYFTKAIELDPNWSNAYNNRGAAKIAIGQIDSGCMDLSKAGELGYSQAYETIRKNCN